MVFKRGPLFAGMTTYVVPMLAMAWGLFDHETISTQQLVAMAGVLVMVGLVQSGTTRPEEEFEMQPEATAETWCRRRLGLRPRHVALRRR